MRKVVLSAFVFLALWVAGATGASAACYECQYIFGSGMVCVNAANGSDGKTECNDSQTCGTYGSACTGGGSCSQTPPCIRNRTS